MKTAREFYYEYYKGTSDQVSIQDSYNLNEIHYKALGLSSEEINRFETDIKSFSPEHSNDIKLDDIFKNLLDKMNSDMRILFKDYFIVLKEDIHFSAHVKAHKHEFHGELIFIDIGMSNVIIDYTLIFAMNYLIQSKGLSEKENADAIILFKEYCTNTAKHQDVWRKTGKIMHETMHAHSFFKHGKGAVSVGAVFSQGVHSFIIAHEIEHVFLGHLESEEMHAKYVPVMFTDVMKSSSFHQKEFFADIFAVLLEGGNYLKQDEESGITGEFDFFTSLFPLIAFTIFGQQTDPFVEIKTHPKIVNRYGICRNITKAFDFKETTGTQELVTQWIVDFQQLLYYTQKFGLGKQYSEYEYMPPWV